MGDSVEWFSAMFPGALNEEIVDGVRIVRAGRQWTVHWSAYRRYRGKLTRQFDIVVDEVNTIPFFTPLWADVPKVMFIHQLAREVWWYESAFPLSVLGFLAESIYLWPYRATPVLTVSASTERDLRQLGFQGPITVIPEGLEMGAELPPSKSIQPSFLFVGRLAPSKRIEHILQAFALFRNETGTGTLCVVGSGSETYRQSLTRLAERLGVSESIEFRGRVTASEKYQLMASAHLLLLTSVREGWGLVVSEANACGTPAVVYDVPGLRDSVRHESTGLVVPPQPRYLSDAMVRLITDRTLYARLAAEASKWSRTFSFDETVRVVRVALDQAAVA